jgi:hypothetical protein
MLVAMLQKEVDDLHPKVMQMDEESMLKQVAKNKVS